jgi:hypothetical protein
MPRIAAAADLHIERVTVAKGCSLISNSSQIYHEIITARNPFVESVEIEPLGV